MGGEFLEGEFLEGDFGGGGGSQWHGRFARIDSRESFAIGTPIFRARQATSHESLEFPIRANHATKGGASFTGKKTGSKTSTQEFGSKIRASKIRFAEFGPKFGFRRCKSRVRKSVPESLGNGPPQTTDSFG